MRHLDRGTIVGIRDGALVDAEARRHAEECVSCAAAVEDARARSEAIRETLEGLAADEPVDVGAAKAAVRSELDARRDSSSRRRWATGWLPAHALGRAAVLLLLGSSVVYALPGSPLRDWVERMTASESVIPTGAESSDAEGLELDVPAEGLRLVLRSLEPGQLVDVRWTAGSRALMVAAPGSRYVVSSGGAEVDVESGTVRIELPRAGGPITIEADGRMILRSEDGSVDIVGDVVSRGDDRIVFSPEPE